MSNIALVHFSPDYFTGLAHSIAEAGNTVYWICAHASDARTLRNLDVPENRILDTTAGFDSRTPSAEECRRMLSQVETAEGPRINDIILMDRMLRRKSPEFALRYLTHLERALTGYLRRNRIGMVCSGRDTALNLISMLVSRRLSIPWVVPTRARIPQEMYGFCAGHETEPLIQIRTVTAEDLNWGQSFLDEFIARTMRPALKKSARNFGDVLRLLPSHARVFGHELKKSTVDAGNDYSRYTVSQLVSMYMRRRVNMLLYKLFPPYAPVGPTPFCLYALHTQPESSIDVAGSYFSDQIALLTLIARSLPASHELYVKVHPTDVDGQPLGFYRHIARIPGVRLIGHQEDSRELLKKASLVFALTGTIAYEAALSGRPVIVFARNFFNPLPTIHPCFAPPQLPGLIRKLLDAPVPGDFRERTVHFLAQLRASCFSGEFNRTYGTNTARLTAGDLATASQAFEAVHRALCGPGSRRLCKPQ